MRYQDLPDQPSGRFLYCPACQARYSACKGDYRLATARSSNWSASNGDW